MRSPQRSANSSRRARRPATDFDEAALAIVRRAYARQILSVAGIEDPALEAAFATVPREHFLGPPPWQIVQAGSYRTLPNSAPVLAYQDVLFGLAPHRSVNNGSPSLHAALLHHLNLRPGMRVIHVGAGTGYYTALIARLVGAAGHVVAIEIDLLLAERARAALADIPATEVVVRDGLNSRLAEADRVYVSFGVERPASCWLDCLADDGHLVFPLCVPVPSRAVRGVMHSRHGAALLIVRKAKGFAARMLGPAYFVCADTTTSDGGASREALNAAFERGGLEFVRSLRWKTNLAPERSWFTGDGFSLCYDPPA
jgi:protein-L-isoaspartate(D-aspartate) O-methyltransferase